MSENAFAAALERRFSGRPHVGSVSHVEGMELSVAAARVQRLLHDLGLTFDEGIDDSVRPTYHTAAAVPAGDGTELWIIVSEQPGVGCKIEARVFHVLEESALADEYLATFMGRLAGELRSPNH